MGEFTPIMKDMVVISHFLLFGDRGAMGIVLHEEGKRTLRFLSVVLRVWNK